MDGFKERPKRRVGSQIDMNKIYVHFNKIENLQKQSQAGSSSKILQAVEDPGNKKWQQIWTERNGWARGE